MSIIDEKLKATAGLAPAEQVERMRVLWTKGRNMFSAFFAEIETVRRQIGDDELFASWCFFQLHIDVATQSDMAVALKKDDTARVRRDLAAARQAEKDRLTAEAHARSLAKIERENEIARKRLENAEMEAAQIKESKRIKKAEAAAERKQRKAERTAKEGRSIVRARAAILANPTASRDTICRIADVSPIIYAQAKGQLMGEGKLAANVVLLKGA
jgi:cobalamin biosynthesis Mg chelatase CobN